MTPNLLRSLLRFLVLLTLAIPASHAAAQLPADKSGSASTTVSRILTATEAEKFLPNTVFFRGQSAPIQARNSGGVQFSKDALLLATLVDTSGYSSAVQEKYQAYLITETAIDIGGHHLEPGAYGCGFIAGNVFLVMDIGGHDLLSISSSRDAALRRPTPLQVLPTPNGAGYRLYVGRDYIQFVQAASAGNSPSNHHP